MNAHGYAEETGQRGDSDELLFLPFGQTYGLSVQMEYRDREGECQFDIFSCQY